MVLLCSTPRNSFSTSARIGWNTILAPSKIDSQCGSSKQTRDHRQLCRMASRHQNSQVDSPFLPLPCRCQVHPRCHHLWISARLHQDICIPHLERGKLTLLRVKTFIASWLIVCRRHGEDAARPKRRHFFSRVLNPRRWDVLEGLARSRRTLDVL